MTVPINSTEVLSFQQLGIDPQFAKMSFSALSRDKYLCVREVTDADSNVAIVDLQQGNSLTRHKMKADTAVMHPSRNIIALKGANQLQVFDLNQRSRLKSFALPEGQTVNYWRWIDDETLAFVAGGNVFHWSLQPAQSAPVPIVQLHPALTTGSIMNYQVSHDGQWLAISALVRDGDQAVGKVQLYSKERAVSQVIDACVAGFAAVGSIPIMIFASKLPGQMKLNIFPLGPQAAQIGKKSADLPMSADAQDDLPLQLIISEKYSTVFLFTKLGYLYLVEYETPMVYLSARVSQSTFTQAALARDGGVIALSIDGRMVKFSINDGIIVDYIAKRGSPQAAAKIAAAAGLQMSGDFLVQQFDQLLQVGNFQEAARIAANSPGGSLRNIQTIQKLQRMQAPGGAPPLLVYFSTLLDLTKLNEVESIELCKIVLPRNQTSLIEKWIKEEKLTPTEELGDICKPYDTRIALAIYLRANSHDKIVAAFAEIGAFDKLNAYCQKFGINPNWMRIATIVAKTAPDKCGDLLTHIANNGNPLCDVKQLVQMLLQFQLVRPATGFLIDVLTQDRQEDSDLQTMLFEIALTHAPKIAEELFTRNCFTFYDRQKVAALCERAGNYQRALEHYTDLPSIKRCVVHTETISQDFLVKYFGTMSPDWAIDCLRELLVSNPRQNVNVVVQIAGTYWKELGIDALINLFNETNSSEGIYFFLAVVVNTCEDPDIHFRYIEAACKLGNWEEVERMCNESQHLPAERLRDYFMQQDFPNKIPLLVLCNRFEFIEDMTKFLYKKGCTRELETYVQRFNPAMAGRVIGALIDIEAPTEYIQKLLNSVQHTAPIDDLIVQTMKRERIKLLEPLLYARQQSGAIDAATNNGLVLLAVLSNRNGERALRENQYYDPKFVGEVLAKRDAHLACLAFAKGNCDDALLELTNQHQLYKEQARYLVARQDPALWARVLSPENEHMKLVVDAVTSTALPECDDPDRVSQTVKAFIDAEIPMQLLGLLEKVVMESPQFQNNTSLQNLLIITAIKSDTSRVMNYVTRLGDYSWQKICEHLIQAQLYDEAIAAYKKFGENVEAVRVMLVYTDSIQAASDWANHCDEPAVWGEVARAQLAKGEIVDAIDSFIKAKDTKEYQAVIQCAESQGQYKALVQFLTLARQINNRDPMIETELCFAYAKTDMLAELEELTSGPNSAREKEVGDRCFNEKLYKAAKILYNAIKDYTKLTETLLMLEEFQAAIDSARRAGTSAAWKAVNKACVLAGEFKIAQSAGLQVVVEADLICDVISLYEGLGHFTQIIQLLEAAMVLERAHGGIFTELACLYAKHQPEKVMEHLKNYYQRIALFKVIKQLNAMHLWKELAFAYEKYNEFDNAVLTMMDHPAVAWTHASFKELVAQVSNSDILNRALNFYLQYSPLELNDILAVVGQKMDTPRVVEMFRRTNNLQLVKSWLSSIQSNNIQAVNEALNQMHVEDGNYEALRQSIDSFDLFDGITLARSLENHECLEFRRIASYIYRKQQRWNDAINLSKQDHLYGDCIETAAQSRSAEVVEPLLRFFVDQKLFECFAAATFVCYDLVSSDLILELAWRNDCIDFAMPFLIQSMREQNQAIAKINAQLQEMGGKVEETKEIAQQVASQSQAPAGFAPSAPFPDTGFAPQFPAQGQFPMSTGGFQQAPAPFSAQPAQPFAASGGGFPQPMDGSFQPQFPPF